jgi:type-F conjugative transfer system pilin assembly protein TrbC
MLPLIIFTHLMIKGFMTSALAEGDSPNHGSDPSWIKELTHQAEALSKTHQDEARSIVEGAIAAQPKSCIAAKELVHHGNEIIHESLETRESESRYPRLLVFVSFSIPLPTLKALGSQVNAVGGNLVLRGLVKGSFKETAAKIKELQEEILIDPTLFESYGISSVPTFVLRSEGKGSAGGSSSGLTPEDKLLSGNVSLEYALEQFALSGDQEAIYLLKGQRP